MQPPDDMLSLILLLIFAGVVAGCWFQGLWPSAIAVINITFAGMLATNFWEPTCAVVEENAGAEYTYVYDFLVLWFLFAMIYALLRAITNGLSEHRIEFHPYVELGGRSILAIWCGWVFLCFTVFTMQASPLPASPFGAWAAPSESTFLFASPDLQWAGFAHDRSRGAFSRGKHSTAEVHPDDKEMNVETFDPDGSFTLRYHDRRAKFEKMDALGG